MVTFSVQETYDQIVVEVKLDKASKTLRNTNKQSVTTTDVLKYLQKSGIKVGKCTQKTTLSNFGDKPTLSGFFVFESTRPKMLHQRETPEEKKTAKKDSQNAKNLQETEDKEITKVSRKRRGKRAKSETKE